MASVVSIASVDEPPPSAAAPSVFASPPQRVFKAPPPAAFSAPLPTPPTARSVASTADDPLLEAGLTLTIRSIASSADEPTFEDLDVKDLLAVRRGEEGAEGGEVERALQRFRAAKANGGAPNTGCLRSPPPALPGMDFWDSMARAIDLKVVPRNLKAQSSDDTPRQ